MIRAATVIVAALKKHKMIVPDSKMRFDLKRVMETPVEEIPMMVLEAMVCVSMEIYVLPSVLEVLKELKWLIPFTGRIRTPQTKEQAKAIARIHKQFNSFWANYTFNDIINEHALAYCMMLIEDTDKKNRILRNPNYTTKRSARSSSRTKRSLRREQYKRSTNTPIIKP